VVPQIDMSRLRDPTVTGKDVRLSRSSRLNKHFRSVVFGVDVTDGHAPNSARLHPDARDVRLGGIDTGARSIHSARSHLTACSDRMAGSVAKAKPYTRPTRLDSQDIWLRTETKV